jgi:UDP-GlcNAc:undecaprenyl-phosphate/decaprenyl-phosphate GlcNAc-1-phosphate transferase
LVGALTAFAISAGWCALLPWLGPRWGFVDVPGGDELKIHARPAVPLAGPGLLLGVLVGLSIVGDMSGSAAFGFAILMGLGVADDRWQLSPAMRMFVEFGAAILLATRWWGEGPAFAIVGAAVILVAVNAVNLYDGIDGLAAGSGIVGLGVISTVGWVSATPSWAPLMLAAALVGFLPFNLHPARVFLGDGGAYLLGAVLAVGLWDVGIAGGWPGAVAALSLMGMFGIDLVVTVLRRLRAGQPLFVGDRSHLYDLMMVSGLSVPSVTLRLVILHLVVVGVSAVAIVALAPLMSVVVVALVGLGAIALGWLRAATVSSR